MADEKNCIRHTLVFLCYVILDNRESVYIAYSVLFLYNIEINVLGNQIKQRRRAVWQKRNFRNKVP